ncbi:MAG: OmpA family protein [Treponema sp.]|uniref:OmpA family protein n=1 Tax=Treponema sp. TaxID=166 RepID=UPI0025D8BA58|nr:OmpA family protein [Treponema sp.]MBQ9281869.1 OmpA family protein [Treponema sp.]
MKRLFLALAGVTLVCTTIFAVSSIKPIYPNSTDPLFHIFGPADSSASEKNSDNLVDKSESAAIGDFKKKPSSKGSVSISINPKKGFTPDGNGVNDEITFTQKTKDIKKSPESWKVEILDKNNETLKTWEGKGNLPATLKWNGQTNSGEQLFSSETYEVKTTVVPEQSERESLGKNEIYGNAKFKTGVLMEEIIPEKQWKIVVNTIYFDANAATFKDLSKEQAAENKETLDSIAKQVLELSKDIKIEVQGYANNVSNTEEENEKELLPLSKDRADVIKKELGKRGLQEKNLTAVGFGGANPIASWEDQAHWWKNRRVEFIVTK